MKISYAILVVLLLAVALFFEDCDAQRAGGRRRRQRGRRRRPGPDRRRPPAPPQDCGPIPHLEHASALHTEDGVHYACQPGFRLEGTNTITCIDGRWTVAPRCVRQVCPTPPLIAFANPPQLSASGTSVTYTCQAGYRIFNGNGAVSQTLNCNVPLQQWPPLPQCEQIPTPNCGAPPAIANARSEVSGNTATYTCNTGYIRQAGTPSQITCVGNQWTYTTRPACVEDPSTTTPPPRCNAPPCGGTTIMRGNVADSYDVGSRVTYTCITGHRIVGQANNVNTAEVECRSDGTWSTVPTCEPVVCGQPQHAANGNTQVIAATAITYNSQYTYRCIDLYTTTQPTVATCQADGMWSISPPICTIRTCSYTSLPTLANGAPFGVTVNADIAVGTSVAYQCNTDYRLAPSPPASGVLQQITCLSTGTWSAFNYTCVYRYPSSCRDYFVRDNLFASAVVNAEVTVEIDTDGPTATNTPSSVICFKKSDTQVATRVNPTAGGTATGISDCGGTATPVLPGVTFDPTGATQTAGVCETTNVAYALTAAQITALLTSGQNCQQQVTLNCNLVATDANFVAILTNGNAEGLAYSVGPTQLAITGSSAATVGLPVLQGASASCDCHADGTGDCNGCFCSRLAILNNGADTITLPLTGTSPGYVTSYARIAGEPAGGVDAALIANELAVTIGPIQCCETV